MENYIEVKVIEDYKDWRPPIDVKPLVQKMLASVPPKYLGGLESVVLTNSAKFNHAANRRKVTQSGQNYLFKDRLGTYYPAHKGSKAWIELIVDNMIKGKKRIQLWLPLDRDHVISSTLFHELGHHIHKNFVPEFGDKEETAETWRAMLELSYMKQHHRYLRILRPFAPLLKLVRKVALRSDGYREFETRENGRLKKRSKQKL